MKNEKQYKKIDKNKATRKKKEEGKFFHFKEMGNFVLNVKMKHNFISANKSGLNFYEMEFFSLYILTVFSKKKCKNVIFWKVFSDRLGINKNIFTEKSFSSLTMEVEKMKERIIVVWPKYK